MCESEMEERKNIFATSANETERAGSTTQSGHNTQHINTTPGKAKAEREKKAREKRNNKMVRAVDYS
jgi:hypothetical protein